MLKNQKIIYNYLSSFKSKHLSILAAGLILMILLGIALVYIFQGPPQGFQPQFSCEARPFTVRLSPNSEAEFDILFITDTKASIIQVSLGDMPQNISANILPTEDANKRIVRLRTKDNPQIGSFSIAIFFTERLFRQNFTTNCQFNLIVE